MFLKKKEFTKLSTWETLLTSPALLAFTEANKPYINSIKTSEVEDYVNLLESIESWNFDEDEISSAVAQSAASTLQSAATSAVAHSAATSDGCEFLSFSTWETNSTLRSLASTEAK